jgi:hypothetical protein
MANPSGSLLVRRLALFAGGLFLFVPGCGGSSKLEFYSNEPGNFRVLVAGKPGNSSQAMASPAGEFTINTIESVDDNQIRRIVVYGDIPMPMVQSSNPSDLLEGGIRGMSGKPEWAIQRKGEIMLDGHPGRDVRFTINSPESSEKGTGAARIFLVGNRLYQAIMVGATSKVSEEELDHFVKSFELLTKVSRIAEAPPPPKSMQDTGSPVAAQEAPPSAEPPPKSPQPTPIVSQPTRPDATSAAPARPARVAQAPPPGSRKPARTSRAQSPRPSRGADGDRVMQTADAGPDPSKPAEIAIDAGGLSATVIERPAPNGNEKERFREAAPKRGLLVGMRVGFEWEVGRSKVASIQPIFQVGGAYSEGTQFGTDAPGGLVTVVARPGYAVGAINTYAGLMVDAFQVVFMRFKDGQLDPDDSYTTDWLGDSRGGGPGAATGEGKPVVGIHGRTNGRAVFALGLLVAE